MLNFPCPRFSERSLFRVGVSLFSGNILSALNSRERSILDGSGQYLSEQSALGPGLNIHA